MPEFTRGFRLHHNGQVLDGAQFPSGRVFVVDDPEYGLASAAVSMEELLKGYHRARVEWAPVADHGAYAQGIQDAIAELKRDALGVLPRLARMADEARALPEETPVSEVVHTCPREGSNVTPCCDRMLYELPRTDRITADPDSATCTAGAQQDGAQT